MATKMDVEVVEVPVGSRLSPTALPIYWGPVWVGALGALVAAMLGGLFGVAFRAYDVAGAAHVGPAALGVPELIASVCSAFFAFVIGGYVASSIAGVRRAEPAMLQGAIVWLVAVPLIFLFVTLGARNYFGAWYGGLVGTPAWAAPGAPIAAKAAREAAGGAATALLIGLVGSVVGGWMGSGEPMTFTHYRTRGKSRGR